MLQAPADSVLIVSNAVNWQQELTKAAPRPPFAGLWRRRLVSTQDEDDPGRSAVQVGLELRSKQAVGAGGHLVMLVALEPTDPIGLVGYVAPALDRVNWRARPGS